MVTAWRRAFCTSIPEEKEHVALPVKQHDCDSNSQSPRVRSKFGFFSNPSTPHLQSLPVSSPNLHCRTTIATSTPTSSIPNSPKIQCTNTTNPSKSQRLFQFSTPSSPKSPSNFSFLKASLRLSRGKCGICMQSVKASQGKAIFTSECSHIFHFPCIAAHVKHNILLCPVCNTSWKDLPSLAINSDNRFNLGRLITEKNRASDLTRDIKTKSSTLYDDDEPIMSPSSVARFFNPIPESDENEEDQEDDSDHNTTVEFQGFFSNRSSPRTLPLGRKIELRLSPEAAIVAVSKSYETYVVVLKVKAPPSSTMNRRGRLKSNAAYHRAPVDLVTVLDVGGSMTGPKLQMLKRSMRLVISSLAPTDRLSIVAFSSTSKRLLPLRRMDCNGQRSALRIVDALATLHQNREPYVKNEALKKAAKVFEDRRERNPIASIMVLSDGQDESNGAYPSNQNCFISSQVVKTARFDHLEIPVHCVRIADGGAYNHAPSETDAVVKCVGGLLNVLVQDLELQLRVVSRNAQVEMAAVYTAPGRPFEIRSGSGLVRLGNLCAEEERELLVELRVPAGSSTGPHPLLSVRSSYRDPSTQELIYSKEQTLLLPRPHTVRSADPRILRLRNVHVIHRAVAESRRLMEHDNISGAYHVLSSARALLLRSEAASADEYQRWLERELNELQRRRKHRAVSQSQHPHYQSQRQRGRSSRLEQKIEPLTPTSAWRAAERLAKVAMTKKSMNRVSDLHGFENARF